MLDLNEMRAKFAAYLTNNFHKSKSLDAALMHVLTKAYQQGLKDGLESTTGRMLEEFARRIEAAELRGRPLADGPA